MTVSICTEGIKTHKLEATVADWYHCVTSSL